MDIDLTEIQTAMSKPQLIQYPSPGGIGYAYGYYYPPSRWIAGSSSSSRDENDDNMKKPPLLVKAHGGPTSQTSTTFRLLIHFWTSRGFAVLDVDYGGSTGKGAAYRKSLHGKWGIVDVNDVCAGATYCIRQGWVHPKWVCIDGSSAGGYTTLAALTFRTTFLAGASLYGISDLTALARDTHKFESHYLDGLVGSYPKDQSIFDERCPILFPEKLNCPILLLQGLEDKVVPPNQAEGMFHALKEKGLLTSLVMYKGEQHGFRKKKNIQHVLNSEYSFFCQVFGIEPEEGTEELAIGVRLEM
jgi:dipeptidyl aminopeptidase/acylaminoacyl peptidase